VLVSETWGRYPIRMFSTAVLCGIAATACSDAPTPPTAPVASRATDVMRGSLLAVGPSHLLRGAMNTASVQLAHDVPGFGGAFVDGGVLNVYLTSDLNTAHGQSVARAAISQLLASGGRPAMAVRFLSAKYSFAQLQAWENALKKSFHRLGVHTEQIDERGNRLKIRLSDPSAGPMLSAQLASLGIPADVVGSEAGGPRVVPFTTLSNKVRPGRGGLSVLTMFSYGGTAYRFGCTYGFNAEIDDGSGTRYVVTNAHCVEPDYVFGGLIGATVAQPDSSVSSLVGYVTANPPSQSGLMGCAPGDSCRESDAVLVQADNARFPASSWDWGGIEATASRGVGPNSGGSTTITGRIALANASTIFFAGDTLEKIGATTGWTAGVVTGTCVYQSDGVGGGRMCNGVVSAGANHGDSGSPVFWRDTNGNYHLMGILWGGPDASPGHNSSEFWFSRFQSIEDELAPGGNLLVVPGPGGCIPPPGQRCPM
jgi:hypothetical protein